MISDILFGVAGNPPNFWQSQFKKERANSPEWLHSIGLNSLEIQCTYGVRMPEIRRELFKINAIKYNIELSIHAPYYINIGSSNHNKIENTKRELSKCLVLAKHIKSRKIIFHPGGIEKDRNVSINNAITLLKEFEDENDMNDVFLYPEVEGKINKLGSLEDILLICKQVKFAKPCIDFAHLHAITNGSLKTEKNYEDIFYKIEKSIGEEYFQSFHAHLYPVDWKEGVGEQRHRAFDDIDYSNTDIGSSTRYFLPRYEAFLNIAQKRKYMGTIICEAKDSQDVGALMMKNYWNTIK